VAAVRVIVEEAGGLFTDRHGEATHEHDTAISTNGLLHDRVIALLTP
jgi:histidinol-phosphatase